MIKNIFKKYIPRNWAGPLQISFMKIMSIIFFLKDKGKKKHHIYSGFPLEIYMGDPVSKQWYDHDWVRDEIEFLRQNKLKTGACVFNIGAHQCVVALILSKIVGKNGLVVAVEMNSHHIASAKINKKNNDASNLHIIHAAVAEKKGTVFFNNDQIQPGPIKRGLTKVRSVSIDDLTDLYGPPSLLYIDVEGYECNVLRGAKKTLRYYPDCCIEVHIGCEFQKFNCSLQEIISYFPQNIYSLYMAPATHKCNFVPFDHANNLIKDRFYLVALNNKSD